MAIATRTALTNSLNGAIDAASKLGDLRLVTFITKVRRVAGSNGTPKFTAHTIATVKVVVSGFCDLED